jgi:hypothetical protein
MRSIGIVLFFTLAVMAFSQSPGTGPSPTLSTGLPNLYYPTPPAADQRHQHESAARLLPGRGSAPALVVAVRGVVPSMRLDVAIQQRAERR